MCVGVRGLAGFLFLSPAAGVFRAPARGCFASPARGRPPAAHFSQQLEKWAKEPEETKGFFTSFRAMSIANLTPPATRSRKSSCVVPSKDCLSNSAAAADANAEQRFWFYRRASHSRNHIKTAKAFQLGYFALRREGVFRAPARPTFGNSAKSRQKHRKEPKVPSPPCALWPVET